MHRIILIIALTFFSLSLKAQEPVLEPLRNNDAVMHNHFKLDNDKINASFEAALPSDIRLIVSAYKLSDCAHLDSLPQIIDIAVNTIAHVTDSFKSANATKVINMHIPIANDPVTVNYKEIPTGTTMIISNNAQSPLKIGMDTVSILKTYSQKTNKDKSITLSQVQYVFLVKDIDDLKKLQGSELLVNVSHTMDSIVKKYNKKSLSKYLDFRGQYNPLTDSKKPTDKLMIMRAPFSNDELGIGSFSFLGSFGVDLVRNTWMPYLDVGVKYITASTPNKIEYIDAFVSEFLRYDPTGPSQFQGHGAEFINVGFWARFLKTTIPFSNVGLAYGYKIYSNDPTIQGRIFRVLFIYGVTPAIDVKIGFNDNLTHLNQSYMDIGATVQVF